MINKDVQKHLEMSYVEGKYNKTLLGKLLMIKSLEICNLAEQKGLYIFSLDKYKIEDSLNKLK